MSAVEILVEVESVGLIWRLRLLLIIRFVRRIDVVGRLGYDDCLRKVEQRLGAHLDRSKGADEETIVVVVAIASAKQGHISLADNKTAATLQTGGHILVGTNAAGILSCLVVVEKSADHKTGTAFGLRNTHIETAHHKMSEIILAYGKQKFVGRHLGRIERKDEYIGQLALDTEGVGDGTISGGSRDCCATSPYVANVELASMQAPTLMHSLENH